MRLVESVTGPQYGSLGWTSSIGVGSVVVPMAIAAAFNVVTVGFVVAVAIGMLICSVLAQRRARVTVDDDGVSCVFPGGKLHIPWSDIEAIEVTISVLD